MKAFKLSDLRPDLAARIAAQIAREDVAAAKRGAETRRETSGGAATASRRQGATKRPSGKSNATEDAFRAFWAMRFGRVFAFEPVSLPLAGGCGYTPDWLVDLGGEPAYAEVKGNYRLPSAGRSRLAFLSASERFPRIAFIWAKRGKGWTIEIYRGGRRESARRYDELGAEIPAPKKKKGEKNA